MNRCMLRWIWTTAVIALFACNRAAVAEDETFAARGNEPAWSLRKSAVEITFRRMEGPALTVAPVPAPTWRDGTETFQAKVGGKDFMLVLAPRRCTDTMSGMPYPVSVTVRIGNESFSGCGGDPATLLRGAWHITRIDGKPVIAKTEPGLDFSADGKISGNVSCNRVMGGYTLSGEGLEIGQLATSMMMCEDRKMTQERTILDILGNVKKFAIGDDGALTLKAGDGRAIAARR